MLVVGAFLAGLALGAWADHLVRGGRTNWGAVPEYLSAGAVLVALYYASAQLAQERNHRADERERHQFQLAALVELMCGPRQGTHIPFVVTNNSGLPLNAVLVMAGMQSRTTKGAEITNDTLTPGYRANLGAGQRLSGAFDMPSGEVIAFNPAVMFTDADDVYWKVSAQPEGRPIRIDHKTFMESMEIFMAAAAPVMLKHLEDAGLFPPSPPPDQAADSAIDT